MSLVIQLGEGEDLQGGPDLDGQDAQALFHRAGLMLRLDKQVLIDPSLAFNCIAPITTARLCTVCCRPIALHMFCCVMLRLQVQVVQAKFLLSNETSCAYCCDVTRRTGSMFCYVQDNFLELMLPMIGDSIRQAEQQGEGQADPAPTLDPAVAKALRRRQRGISGKKDLEEADTIFKVPCCISILICWLLAAMYYHNMPYHTVLLIPVMVWMDWMHCSVLSD